MEQGELWDEGFAAIGDPLASQPDHQRLSRCFESRATPPCSQSHLSHADIPANCLLFKGAKRDPQQQQQQPDKQAPNTPCMLTLLQPLPFPFPSVFADEETFHGCCPNLQNLSLCPPRAGL